MKYSRDHYILENTWKVVWNSLALAIILYTPTICQKMERNRSTGERGKRSKNILKVNIMLICFDKIEVTVSRKHDL